MVDWWLDRHEQDKYEIKGLGALLREATSLEVLKRVYERGYVGPHIQANFILPNLSNPEDLRVWREMWNGH
jgi:hypothetical protein